MDPEVWGLVPAAPMVVFAALALVIVSLLTQPPSMATVRKFFDPRPPGLRTTAEPAPVGAA
jgi:hypothetical protein